MISHHHRTLFIHIPKCGGQSVELAFLNDLGLSWKNRAPLLLRPRMEGENAPPRLAHLRLVDYLNNHYISKDLFDSYFKFSIIRCPYKRVISFYTYFRIMEEMTLSAFVNEKLESYLQPDHEMHWFFQPQTNYLFDTKNEIGVDAVYTLEDINSCWPEISHLSYLSTSSLPHVNRSATKGITEDTLNTFSRKKIKELYLKDFIAFPQYDK